MDISANGAARHRGVGEYVRDEPLTSLAIAAGAGFVLGGGVSRRIGMTMLATVGRIALRGVATSLLLGMAAGSRDDSAHGRASYGSGRYDNGRTDFQKPG